MKKAKEGPLYQVFLFFGFSGHGKSRDRGKKDSLYNVKRLKQDGLIP